MHTLNDVHQQFAEYFNIPALKPYAYLLSKKISEGHICLRVDTPFDTKELPVAYKEHINKKAFLSIPLVAHNGNTSQPFVLHNNRLYLQRYFRYETAILRQISRITTTEKAVQHERIAMLNRHQAFIKKLFASPVDIAEDNDFVDWQLAAVITGILNNFTILTGGPGTGKTTTVAKILATLYTINPSLKVALAAPTGKAAARMAESLRGTEPAVEDVIKEKFTALEPSTIHRLLRPKKDTPYFHHDEGNPLIYDVVIVDECSMIDVALFAKLLNAIDDNTRLILLGDKDQLASVEAGSLFGDLCNAQDTLNLFSANRLAFINTFIDNQKRCIPIEHISDDDSHPLFQHLVELRRSRRFSNDEGIGKFSKSVINNDEKTICSFMTPGTDEQVEIDQTYSRELFEKFISGYQQFIEEKDILKALEKMNILRVLCAIREGKQGLYATNKAIEKYLQDKKCIKITGPFYENRPIILTKNYYEHGLFNGDTGIIRPDKTGTLMAWFEDRKAAGGLKCVLPGYLTEAETVFAMTIHKSQGSEYKEVFVLLPQSADLSLLTRELLYTAVTRAKSKVYLQSSEKVLLQATQRLVERASGISGRFL